MSAFNHILSLLAPHECLGCSAEGSLLCGRCRSRLPAAPQHCYRCQRSSPYGMTCHGCLEDAGLDRVVAATPYAGVAKELVSRFKFSGAREAARTMASCLLPLLLQDGRSTVFHSLPLVVPVPTATGRARQRGFDQTKLLARELCRQRRLNYMDCLSRYGQSRQLGQSRDRRLKQLEGVYRVRRHVRLRGREVLLVDDVMTTGSTLEAASTALKKAGVRHVTALVFARTL